MARAAVKDTELDDAPDDGDVSYDAAALKPELPKAVKEMAGDRPVTAATVRSATEWFMEQGDDDAPALQHTHVLTVNMGGITEESRDEVEWVITSVDPVEEQRIRRQVLAISRRGKRRDAQLQIEDLDEDEFNCRIVVAGSMEPNFFEVAQSSAKYRQYEAPDKYEAAVKALKWGTRHKPGLVKQIAGAINAMSGYDDEDVKDAQKAGKG